MDWEEQKTEIMDGKPYFLIETEKGVFAAITSITETEKGCDYEHSDDMEELVLGRDISEVPMHGLSLLVQQPKIDCREKYIVAEARKFADKANFSYVGLEEFGGEYFSRLIVKKGDILFLEVRPRVFIPNN